jgi:integrase/recombinase XerC
MVSLLEQGLSKRSVNRKLAALRTFFKWLRKDGKLEENPMTRIQGPKGEKRLPVFVKESELDPQKVNALFSSDFEGLRNSLIVELFYQTGMRLSELIDLKDAAVTQQYIKVLGKRNKERLIPIAPELLQKINQYRVAKRALGLEHPNLLLRINGQALYPQLVYRLVKEVLGTLSGVEKRSPHVLRHTFATHMLNNGAGLETLKDLLGHANLSATQVYTHNSFAQLRKAYGSAHPRALKTP